MIERQNNGGEIRGFPIENQPKTGPVEGTTAAVLPYITSGDITKAGTPDGFGAKRPLEMYQDDGLVSDDEQAYMDSSVDKYDQIMGAKTDMYKKLYAEGEYYTKLHKSLEDNGGDWNSDAREAYYNIWNSRRQRNPEWEDVDPLVYPSKASKDNRLTEYTPWEVKMPWYRRLQYGAERSARVVEESLRDLQDIPYEWASTIGEKVAGVNVSPDALRAIHDAVAPGQRMAQDIGPDAIRSFRDIVRDDGSTEVFTDAIKDTPFSNLDFDRLDTYTPDGLRKQLGDDAWDKLTDAGADLGWDALNVGAVLGGVLRGPAAVKGLSAALKAGSKAQLIDVLKKAVKIKLPKPKTALKVLAGMDKAQWLTTLAGTGAAAGAFVWDAYKEYGTDAGAALTGTAHKVLEESAFLKNQMGMDFSEEFIDKLIMEVPGVGLRKNYADLNDFLKTNNLEASQAQKLFMPEAYDIQKKYLLAEEKMQREWEVENRKKERANMTADQISTQEDEFDQYLEEEMGYDNPLINIDTVSNDDRDAAVAAEMSGIFELGKADETAVQAPVKKNKHEGSAGYKTLQKYLNKKKK